MLKKMVAVMISLVAMLLVTACHEGYASKDGESLKQYVSPEALKVLVENPKEDIWIIDVRPQSAYDKGHIPGAKSYPSSVIVERLGEIPKEKNLIFYCETGGRAQAVIKKLEEKGYTRMMNFGGYTRWKWDLEKTPGK